MISYDSFAWYCMLLWCWVRRAGCVLQDAYILHRYWYFIDIVAHCCYQGAFQEVNILINRAHLVNVKLVLTESLYGKNYFSKTIKVISNLTNRGGTVLSGHTFVQKWLLDYGHVYGQIWPFFTLMAIFTHQTVGRIVRIRPRAAHRGEEDSHKKNQFVPLNFSMCH